MLNILPPQQKIVLKKEYGVRRTVVGLMLVIFALMISLVLLLPSYFSFYLRSGQAKDELERTKQVLNTGLQSMELTAEIATAIHHAESLRPFVAPTSAYDLVRIFESKSASIRISDISFVDNVADERPVISIRGKATDRESLKAFGRAIESRVEFQSVLLPVSNFVKERDIDFSITINVK